VKEVLPMGSISFGSDDNIHLPSTNDLNNTSDSSTNCFVNDSTSSSSNYYTPEQLKHFLFKKDQRFRLDNNKSTKTSASWWRFFEYITIKNKKKMNLNELMDLLAVLKIKTYTGYPTLSDPVQ
jgi:hypothetical protein